MKDKISLQIPYKKEYVSIARLTSSVLASQLEFDLEAIEDIKVAIGEACNNAILHSNKENLENEFFTVTFTVIENGLGIEIYDNGEGFNLNNYEKPNLEEYKENGLGIFIMEALMDEMKIDSQPDMGTLIKMKKYI